MKLTYDPRYNIAYIKLRDKTDNVETIHLSDQVNIDVAPDGKVYGIELLNANELLTGEEAGAFVIVNEASNERSEIPLKMIR